jgi:hydrogenase expression/formation protein HypE
VPCRSWLRGLGWSWRVEEARLPVVEPVARTCELLGFEPLHLANEGRFVAVVPPEACAAARALLEADGGAWIGTVRPDSGAGPRVLLTTALGTERLLVPTQRRVVAPHLLNS